jgi:translation initiation factor 2 gamma subunit (eIF-2gamma)
LSSGNNVAKVVDGAGPMQKIYKCEDECCPQLQTSEHLAAMEIMQNLYKKLLQNLYKKLLLE